jgi:serine/threonine protein kinase/tetratricopeptide (TPR) repeat protein
LSEQSNGPNAPLGDNDTVVATAGSPRVASAQAESLFAGRYQLLEKIGRGGMGTVYRARDTLVGDLVALKILELEDNQRGDLLERFRREVRLARRISHHHVARTHDLGEQAGHLFLTMEYVEGEDLQALLGRERAIGAAQAVRIALAVCEGLAAAHAAGVVHRDLKPANVLVEKGGRVVLTDFGIARAMAGESASRTQGMVGTPMYMSPEQIAGGEVDARSDLYAVGLLLYEMLTGQAPFTGDSPMAVAFARLRLPPPDPSGHPGVTDTLAQLVRQCLAREPAERPAGAQDMVVALSAWLTSAGEPLEVRLPMATPVPGALDSAPRPAARTQSRPGALGLAVLPLRFIGPKEQDFLGDAVTESLIDALSRTQGTRVQSSGATARFRSERDPRVVGRELGVELVVDGSVQSLGKLVRGSLRLVEVSSGVQLWSGRLEDSGEDIFALQDRLGRRMAETLRSELLIATYRDQATPELITSYRQTLVMVSTAPRVLPEEVLGPLEECIQQAPGFLPAVALHALAFMRTWFMRTSSSEQDWSGAAWASVERASQQAPDIPETMLAKALRATQDGQWRPAVVALRAALGSAPTFAGALQYLGSLQCEAGRADEGLARLHSAFELDPALSIALFEMARCSALRGKMDEYRQYMDQLWSYPFLRLPALLLRLRVSAWSKDFEDVKLCQEELRGEPAQIAINTGYYAAAVLGQEALEPAMARFDGMLAAKLSTRFASMVCQLATEVLCLCGQPERAVAYFLRAADSALIDLEWVDRCQALKELRTLPGFLEGRLKVRARVESIWSV